MNRSKRKPESHIIGEEAVKIVKRQLPNEWTVRELTPDYGINLDIEIFNKTSPQGKNSETFFDTLGEHLFVQVKGKKQIQKKKLKITKRHNIEKFPLSRNIKYDYEDDPIDVVAIDIETPEIVTVQRMGASLPLLLFLVDIETSKIYFICLNDYIEKVILPEDPDYSFKKSKRIYIPIKNEITTHPDAILLLEFYAKRPKLFAAFNKFSYQREALDYVYDDELIERATYFAKILLRYDFWHSKGMIWKPIKDAHQHLENLVDHSCPDIFQSQRKKTQSVENIEWTSSHSRHRSYMWEEVDNFLQIRVLWDRLVNLGAVYEEICRELMLPTYVGITISNWDA